MDQNMRRELILDHYQNPTNKGLIDSEEYRTTSTSSDSCIDHLDFMLKIEDGVIQDIRFDGEACAISTSATSIMISSFIGKTVEETKQILKEYQKMIDEEEYDADVLGDLVVYDEISKQPNRKNCALMPAGALLELLEK